MSGQRVRYIVPYYGAEHELRCLDLTMSESQLLATLDIPEKQSNDAAELERLQCENATLHKALGEALQAKLDMERHLSEARAALERATTEPKPDVHICENGCQAAVDDAGDCVKVTSATNQIRNLGITLERPLQPPLTCDCYQCHTRRIAEIALLRCELSRIKGVVAEKLKNF
jgi:hypothetical protein